MFTVFFVFIVHLGCNGHDVWPLLPLTPRLLHATRL